MYLWQRLAANSWWLSNEAELQAKAGSQLAIIHRRDRKRLTIQIGCRSGKAADRFRRRFGGRVVKLSRDWLSRFTRAQKATPLRIGSRLIITNVEGTSVSRPKINVTSSRHHGRSHFVIPAGPAFGTGSHASTAMSLHTLA